MYWNNFVQSCILSTWFLYRFHIKFKFNSPLPKKRKRIYNWKRICRNYPQCLHFFVQTSILIYLHSTNIPQYRKCSPAGICINQLKTYLSNSRSCTLSNIYEFFYEPTVCGLDFIHTKLLANLFKLKNLFNWKHTYSIYRW